MESAIATSLFVVAVTSLVAMIPHARAGRVRVRTGLIFGAAGMVGAYFAGRVAHFIPARVLMLAFAAMMLMTAAAMLRGRKSTAPAGATDGSPGELPAAKVLLSLRDADRWHESVMNTIHPVMTQPLPAEAPAALRDFHRMVHELIFERTFGGRLGDRAHAKRVYEAHNRGVVEAIPASRLLVYRPGDGWEPLCRFLGVPVPAEPFPHLNDTAEFRARAGLPPL